MEAPYAGPLSVLRDMLPRMGILSKTGRYDGPVCFVDREQKAADGKLLYAGWHYATKIWRGHEIPDSARPLHLNDTDGEVPFYEFADGTHKSWVEKHGWGNIVTLGGSE